MSTAPLSDVTDGDARPLGVPSTLDVAGIVAWGRA
jgi:hypothetical protein